MPRASLRWPWMKNEPQLLANRFKWYGKEISKASMWWPSFERARTARFFQNKMNQNVLEPINRLQLFVCLLILTAQSKLLSSKAPHKPILCRPHVFTQRSEAWRQSYKAVEERLASRKARPLGTPSRIGLREASFRAVLFEIGKTRSKEVQVWMTPKKLLVMEVLSDLHWDTREITFFATTFC